MECTTYDKFKELYLKEAFAISQQKPNEDKVRHDYIRYRQMEEFLGLDGDFKLEKDDNGEITAYFEPNWPS